MDVSTIALGVLGGAAILALGVSVYTLLVHTKVPSVTALHAKITSLETAHTDLVDRVGHWMRRENTRRLRASQEETPPPPAEPTNIKDKLRGQLFRQRMGVE